MVRKRSIAQQKNVLTLLTSANYPTFNHIKLILVSKCLSYIVYSSTSDIMMTGKHLSEMEKVEGSDSPG